MGGGESALDGLPAGGAPGLQFLPHGDNRPLQLFNFTLLCRNHPLSFFPQHSQFHSDGSGVRLARVHDSTSIESKAGKRTGRSSITGRVGIYPKLIGTEATEKAHSIRSEDPTARIFATTSKPRARD